MRWRIICSISEQVCFEGHVLFVSREGESGLGGRGTLAEGEV